MSVSVFISWSGNRSKLVAQALAKWLERAMQNVETWVSSSDISAGSRWAVALADRLASSRIAVVCLTPENKDAPWVHFEAGAIARDLAGSLVCPYLIGINKADLSAPLGQFQAVDADKDGTRDLLLALNRAQPDESRKPEEVIRDVARVWWPELEKSLSAIAAELPKAGGGKSQRDLREIAEEILERVRAITRAEYLTTNIELPYRASTPTVLYTPEFLKYGSATDEVDLGDVGSATHPFEDLKKARKRLDVLALSPLLEFRTAGAMVITESETPEELLVKADAMGESRFLEKVGFNATEWAALKVKLRLEKPEKKEEEPY